MSFTLRNLLIFYKLYHSMAKKNQVRVSPNQNGWRKVHKPWAQRSIQTFENKKEAVNKATEVAKNQSAELKIQKKDGSIQWGNSYGWDPFPPRDKK